MSEEGLSEMQDILGRALGNLPIEKDSAVVAMFLCKKEKQTLALLQWIVNNWTEKHTPTQREIMDEAQRIHHQVT